MQRLGRSDCEQIYSLSGGLGQGAQLIGHPNLPQMSPARWSFLARPDATEFTGHGVQLADSHIQVLDATMVFSALYPLQGEGDRLGGRLTGLINGLLPAAHNPRLVYVVLPR